MSINDIVRSWKADDDQDEDKDEQAPESPAGKELSDEELEKVAGGMNCGGETCDNNTCSIAGTKG